MSKFLLHCIVVIVALSIITLPVPAQRKAGGTPSKERILVFASSITVNSDASLQICEKIKVITGATIKHGIYREIPLAYTDSQGHAVRAKLTVLGVKRDGKLEGYHTETVKDRMRIYVGKKHVVIPAGEHTYSLTYKIDRQIAFLRDRDELYWNVTGNEWGFPIDRVMATVTLPKNVPSGSVEAKACTGRKGARGKAYRAQIKRATILFSTSKALKTGEGLTVIVSIPKGHVKESAAAKPKPSSKRS